MAGPGARVVSLLDKLVGPSGLASWPLGLVCRPLSQFSWPVGQIGRSSSLSGWRMGQARPKKPPTSTSILGMGKMGALLG